MGCGGSSADAKDPEKAAGRNGPVQGEPAAQEHKEQETGGKATGVQAGGHVGTILFEGSRLLKHAKQSELDF